MPKNTPNFDISADHFSQCRMKLPSSREIFNVYHPTKGIFMKLRCQANRKWQKISPGSVSMFISLSIVKKADGWFFSKFSNFSIFFPKKLNYVALKMKMESWDGFIMKAEHLGFWKILKPAPRSFLKWRNVQKYLKRWKSWKFF